MAFLIQEETANQTSFSVEHLRNITDFYEVLSYLNTTLGKVKAKGSSRRIWLIDNSKIIKVAKTIPDSEQNRNEVKHSKCLGSKFAPVIFDYDEVNYFWIIEERLKRIGETEMINYFSKKFNHPFKNYFEIVALFAYVNDEASADKHPFIHNLFPKLIQTNEWFKTIVDELRTCHVETWDFHDENWGIRPSTGEIVLLDLGF